MDNVSFVYRFTFSPERTTGISCFDHQMAPFVEIYIICFSHRDNSSYEVNNLGPLCPWQCFYLPVLGMTHTALVDCDSEAEKSVL